MRIVIAILLGLVGGFFAGIVISQVIGIIGMLVFQQAIGIKFLPIYTALAGAIIAPSLLADASKREITA